MANEYEMKTSAAAGPDGTLSPVKSPAGVLPAFRPAWVYVMHCQDRTKIGIAYNVQQRRRHIETATGLAVVLCGERQFARRVIANTVELRLHRIFAASRLHGEWFSIGPDVALAALNAADTPALPHRLAAPEIEYDAGAAEVEEALAHLDRLIARDKSKRRAA